MINISIIIAVYNVSKYLNKCLDSVIKQKGDDIEIIIVNDGSTDNSLNICKLYEKKDRRIKIITEKNKGLSAVRNIGFKNSKGKYIWHIDGDDYLDDNSVDIIRNYIDKYDIIFFDFLYFDEKSGNRIKMIDSKKYDNKESRYILSHPVIWNKVFKRELFEGELFPENCTYNDIYLIPSLVSKTKKIIYLNKCLYNYVYRSNSLSNSRIYNLKDMLFCLNNNKGRLEKEYPMEVECLFINYLLFIPMIKLVKEKAKFNPKCNNKILKEIYPKYYKNKYWNNRGLLRKIYIRLMYYDMTNLVKIITFLKLKVINTIKN